MKVIYKTEYEEELLIATATCAPPVGQTVVIWEERYVVKDVEWYPHEDAALVIVGEKSFKQSQVSEDISGRLSEMNRAILDVSKRQDASEKKARSLNEQLVTVRTAIRSLPKPKPGTT